MTKLVSVERSFAILRELIAQENSSMTEISEELDIPSSTMHDHLSKLIELGYVTRDGNQYQPSMRIMELAEHHRQRMPLYQHSKPQLQDLTNQIGEHATVMIEENGLGTLVYTTESDCNVNFAPHPGSQMKLHRTGEGKAILAYLSEDRRREIVNQHELDNNHSPSVGNRNIPPKTQSTITDENELFTELETVREQGYAFASEELIRGIRSIGVPIISDDSIVMGSIGIYSPVNKLTDDTFHEEFPDLLLRKANIIEININYS